jgi:hypothetical protein
MSRVGELVFFQLFSFFYIFISYIGFLIRVPDAQISTVSRIPYTSYYSYMPVLVSGGGIAGLAAR